MLEYLKINKILFYLAGGLFILLAFYLTSQSYNGSQVIRWGTESGLYHDNAKKVLTGQTPFFDYFVEYPPLVPYLLTIPAFLTFNFDLNGAIYIFVYPLLMMILSFGVYFYLLREKWKSNVFWIVGFGINFLIGASYIITRYDFYPTITCFLGILFYIQSLDNSNDKTNKNFIISVIFLALSIFLKVYALFPLILITILSYKNWLRLKIIFVVLALFSLVQAPFVFTKNFSKFVEYQTTSRDAQLESTYAGISLLTEKITNSDTTNLVGQNGSMELNDTFSKNLSKLSTYVVLILAVLPICIFGYRELKANKFKQLTNLNTDKIIYLSFAIILGVLVSSKIFSPQYWFWILGMIPLLAFVKENNKLQKLQNILLILAFTTVTYMTYWIWPVNYGQLMDKEIFAIGVLNVRNLLVLIIYFYFLFKTFYTPKSYE